MYQTRKTWIATVFVAPEMYAEEAGKTVGKAIVGEKADKVFLNRRNILGKLTEEGEQILDEVIDLLQKYCKYPMEKKFDRYAGCSMCPCSPGFKIIAHIHENDVSYQSGSDVRFHCWIGKEGITKTDKDKEGNIKISDWIKGIERRRKQRERINNNR